MILRNTFVCLCVCLAVFADASAEAETVTLKWNRNPEPNVTGYRLSIGYAPGVYTGTVEVGNTLTWSVDDLRSDQTYYFALQAYDALGRVSAYSAEVVRRGYGVSTPGTGAFLDDGEMTPLSPLIWQHEEGWLSTWTVDGSTLLATPQLNPDSVSDRDWRIVGAADFDEDLQTDLVWHHRERGEVVIWLMDGQNRRRSVAVDTEDDLDWNIVAVGDMDGDANPDLIWQHRTARNLAVSFMKGTASSHSAHMSSESAAGDTWSIVGAADFNRDGHTDLLWQHREGTLAAWMMNGLDKRDVRQLTPSSVGRLWKVVAVADYNKDGRADLVFQKEDGHLATWFLDGLAMTSAAPLDAPQVKDPQWKVVGPR